MTNTTSVKPENFRHVSVPLSLDHIKEFFDNKELFFLVNYSDSKIKGNMFLTYISNLGLPSEIVLTGATLEEKFELLKFYMETRNINDSGILKIAAAQIILENKGFDLSPLIQNPVFTREEATKFIELNKEMVNRWCTFLSSSIMYYVSSIPVLAEEMKIKDSFPMIDDPHYVGCNIVQMFSVPGFTEFFFAFPHEPQIYYFKQQFEEYMFKGKNLFHYFAHEENTLLLVFNELLTGTTNWNDMEKILEGAV